jgi:hypothetical protein
MKAPQLSSLPAADRTRATVIEREKPSLKQPVFLEHFLELCPTEAVKSGQRNLSAMF